MPEGPVYVIIGASLAGAKAAETLREDGSGGTMLRIGFTKRHMACIALPNSS